MTQKSASALAKSAFLGGLTLEDAKNAFTVLSAAFLPAFLSLFQASLVVNVASYSEQTEGNYRYLQELHRELGTSHFNVLAFPCGQFGDTEPGTSRDSEAFAKSTYGVTFPFFNRIKIMGSEAEPAFRFLTGLQTQQLCLAPDCALAGVLHARRSTTPGYANFK